jgi:carbonic anhydrase/acetyltransferase-like protein (isoleucine patch superfamily)
MRRALLSIPAITRSAAPKFKRGGAERIDISSLYKDDYCKHRMRINLDGRSIATPLKNRLSTSVSYMSFVAPSATLAGNVELWDHSSVWYGCVIKADINLVRIGAFTNIQDNTTIYEAFGPLNEVHDGSTVIGHHVTVGHSCHLTACTIEDESLVGMGSVLQEGSYMETHSMLGAGSVLTRGSRIPSGQLWVGNPAKFVRYLTAAEIASFRSHARKYSQLAYDHKVQFLPHGTQYIEAEKLGYKIGWQGMMEANAQFLWNPKAHE